MRPDDHQHHAQYRGPATKNFHSHTTWVDVPPTAAQGKDVSGGALRSGSAAGSSRRGWHRYTTDWRRLMRYADGVHRAWRQPSRRRVLILALIFAVALFLLFSQHNGRAAATSASDGAHPPLRSSPPLPSWEPSAPPDAEGWYCDRAASLQTRASPHPNPAADFRTARPRPASSDAGGVEAGAVGVEEPERLPGVITHYRLYTPEALLTRYSDMTILYSFVNGSEASHAYRSAMLSACADTILSSEMRHFAQSTLLLLWEYWDAVNRTRNSTPPSSTSTAPPWQPPRYAPCFPSYLDGLKRNNKRTPVGTVRAVLDLVKRHISPGSRDRETDELRHSFRSVEAHMQWHTGRVVVVSPGHHAQWVDGAKNFLASRCGAAAAARRTSAGGRHTQPHVRVTTVHQDAVLPYGMRLTLNSHTVEKYLWRVRNLTSVHLYFNDDYFVNRDTAITDFLNPFGGTIIRTERSVLWKGLLQRPKKVGSWAASTSFTQHFDTIELDVRREDYLPPLLMELWAERLSGVDYLSARDATLTVPSALQADTALPGNASSVVASRGNDISTSHDVDIHPRVAEADDALRLPTGYSESEDSTSSPSLLPTAVVPNSSTLPIATHTLPAPETPPPPSHAPLASSRLFRRLLSAAERLTDVAIMSKEEVMPFTESTPRRVRRFPTHAPFTYCTAMHRYFAVRYEREFAKSAFRHRHRHRQDLLVPFIYNAYAMARPWAASPTYLQYLFDLHTYYARTANASVTASSASPVPPPSTAHIYLDNDDGCAPSTMYSGPGFSQCMFTKFLDDKSANEKVVASIHSVNPLFFNINAGFTQDKAAHYLRAFLRGKFPHPSYLEGDAVAAKDQTLDDDATGLRPLYTQLMGLPLVLLTSYAHGACPLVRSLQLSLADHRGPVWVVVHRSAVGEDVAANATVLPDETLSEARRRLRHRVYNAMPVLRCTFRPDAVSVVTVDSNASLWAEMRRVVGEGDAGAARAGVVLPDSCRSGGRGCAGGRRVRGFVVDARARRVPPADYMDLVHALTMPGQTLALEDLTAVPLHGAGAEAAAETLASDDVLLSVSVAEAESSGVHWIFGASESDLLLTYPLPVEKYEDMSADAQWI